MTRPNGIVTGGIAVVGLVPCGIWTFAASIFWTFRYGLMAPAPPEAVATSTHVAVVTAIVAGLNLIAVVIFLLKPMSYGWWLLVGVEVGNAVSLAAWLILGHYTDTASVFLFCLGAATASAATVLLLAFRFRSVRGGMPPSAR